MSYDVYLRTAPCLTCGHNAGPTDLPGPTYNLTPIFDRALTGEDLPNADVSEASAVLFKAPTDRPRGLRVLNGRTGRETAEQIRYAIDRLRDRSLHLKFKSLEPANGWGTLADAVVVLDKLAEAAERFPDGVWDVR